MLDAITQPYRFFQMLSQRKPNLTMPLVLALLSFTLAGIAQTLASRLLPSFFPISPAVQYLLAVASVVVFGLLVFAVGGTVIRLIAGPDSRAWEIYGWSFMPGLLVGLLMLPLGALMPITGDVPPAPALTDQEAAREWGRGLGKIISNSSYTRITQGLGIVSNLWALWIIWSGLRVTAPSRATTATAAIALLTIALTVWGLTSRAG